MFFLIICLIFAAFLIIRTRQYLQRHRFMKRYIDKINGPTAWPIVGHLHMALCTPTELIRKVIGMSTLFKSPGKIWIFNQPFVGVFSPQDIQVVTSRCLDKHNLFRSMSVLIGDGLITANGERWKRSRSIVSSSFNLSIMSKNFLDVFNRHNSYLMQRFQRMADTEVESDIWPHVFKTFYDLISETAMGHSHSIDEEEFSKSRKNFEKACQLIFYRFVRPWLWPSFLFNSYLYLTGRQNIIPSCQSLPLKILDERKEAFIQQHMQKGDSNTSGGNSFSNLIDALLNTKEMCNRFTDQEIVDEVLTIQFAGSETTALNTCFTLLMLATHTDSQEKVHEELDYIFGDSDHEPTLEDVSGLTFLEQCIKETMRRFTVAPISMRVASTDVKLSNRVTIPAGSNIIPMYFLVHLDRTLYPNPESWNPHNFDPDQEAKRPPGSFVPFGSGPRMCIGYKYAMLAMKTLISTILRKFKLTTSLKEEDLIISVDILSRCTNGFPVKFHPKT